MILMFFRVHFFSLGEGNSGSGSEIESKCFFLQIFQFVKFLSMKLNSV